MQIVIGLFLLVIIATLLAARFEAISHQAKMQIFKVATALFAVLWLYEHFTDRHDAKVRALYLAFKQGEKIVCDGKTITRKDFFFETGTESFISLDDAGIVYPVDSCEIASD